MPPSINWYQSPTIFMPWHEENATKEIYIYIYIYIYESFCIVHERKETTRDEQLAIRSQRVEEQFVT